MVDFINLDYVSKQMAQKMGEVVKHRGPDQSGTHIDEGIALWHNHLAIVDIARGLQPRKCTYEGKWILCQ